MSKPSLFEQLCSSQVLLDAWKSVKSKNAAGGIDGISVSLFDKDIGSHITSLLEELRRGRWSPSPYLRVDIPKKGHEKRQLGLLTIKDKIVQQAIASLLQPRFDSSSTRVALASNILERFNRYEKYRGEEIRFEQVIQRQATEIAQYITEHKTYRPYLAKW